LTVAADPPPPSRKPRNRVIERLRGYFFAGVVVTGPTLFTAYLTWVFIEFIDGAVRWLLPDRYNPATYLHVPGLGLILGVITLTLIGAATANYVGRIFLRLSDRLLARMPVVRGIYGAAKQIFETVLAKQSGAFREVVLIEFPRREMWTLGFLTGHIEGEIQEISREEVLSVMVPTTPNPTSGYLVFVPRRDVVPLSMTVEEGIKLVVSGGIVTPPVRRPTPVLDRASV